MGLPEILTVAGLLAGGLGIALLGSVKLALARKLEMDEARVGGLISAFGLTTIPAFIVTGLLTDMAGKQPVIVGGSVLLGVSLIVLGVARRYGAALLAVVILAAAWSALICTVNPLALLVFGGPGKPEVYATALACFYFGVGALLTPLAVGFLLQRVGLTKALVLLAGLVLIPAILAAAADPASLAAPPDPQAATSPEAPGMLTLLGDPFMWLCILTLLFYGPLEAATGAWTTTYLSDNGVSERAASGLLSAFWATYTASRLGTAVAVATIGLAKQKQSVLILAFGVLAVAVLSGIVWGRGRRVAITMVIAAGLIFGPIFPAIMAVLLGHFDPSVHGRAIGLLFAVGGIGTVTIPAAMGAYAKRTSVQRGFLIAVGSAAALTAVALILVLRG